MNQSHAEDISLYGSEQNKWDHNPILHPLKWLKDPYYLERLHYHDRPYPVASPAFSNVPLVGPLLAATIGRFIKPTVRMHEEEWNGEEYDLYSPRIEPRGPNALPPPKLKDEFTLGNALKQEVGIGEEYTGIFGFGFKSIREALFPDTNEMGKEVYHQGSPSCGTQKTSRAGDGNPLSTLHSVPRIPSQDRPRVAVGHFASHTGGNAFSLRSLDTLSTLRGYHGDRTRTYRATRQKAMIESCDCSRCPRQTPGYPEGSG
jgi:hypothetical protein